MIMLMSPMIADHLYRGYFEGTVNYIGQEVFGTMRVFMGYDANPTRIQSATNKVNPRQELWNSHVNAMDHTDLTNPISFRSPA